MTDALNDHEGKAGIERNGGSWLSGHLMRIFAFVKYVPIDVPAHAQ